MAAIVATACPRCGGSLLRERDGETGCLQCGWAGATQDAVPVEKQALLCRACGNHVRSKAHREACKRQEAKDA